MRAQPCHPLRSIPSSLAFLPFACFFSPSSPMAASSPDSSSEYLIVHHEKVRWIDILSLLILRRSFLDYHFVESSQKTKLQLGNARASWPVWLSMFLIKILNMIKLPLAQLGLFVEYACNAIKNLISGKAALPVPGTADYQSIVAFLDGRKDLYGKSPFVGYTPKAKYLADVGTLVLDIYLMAAKVAYENEAYIRDVVTTDWKMNFVGFFDCWNKFLEAKTTQAFIFTDKPLDASFIMVAFRGTEPFNAVDWITDVDFSWLSLGKMGQAHVGFMKALGLQDDKDYIKGWPKTLVQDPTKPVAYYSIRDSLKKLLLLHPKARVLITGHSLGGALAVLFPAILKLHGENDILNKLYAVATFGQPRVGDEAFAEFMTTGVQPLGDKILRMVYRYDLVPRVPFDNLLLFNFKHFGICYYFKGWYEAEEVEEVPSKNYFDIRSVPSMYWNAVVDLFRGLTIGIVKKDYREGPVSIGFRALGLLIPGFASHSPRDYVNAERLANIVQAQQPISTEYQKLIMIV